MRNETIEKMKEDIEKGEKVEKRRIKIISFVGMLAFGTFLFLIIFFSIRQQRIDNPLPDPNRDFAPEREICDP